MTTNELPAGLYRVTGCRACDESPKLCDEHTADAVAELDTVRAAIVAELATADWISDELRARMTSYERAVVELVGSPDAVWEYSMGRMDIDTVDYDSHTAVLLAGLRAAFSACGGHPDRDPSCTDCIALDDLR